MKRILTLTLATLLSLASRLPAQVTISPQQPSGIYQAGQKVQWTITPSNAAAPAPMTYTLFRNGLTSLKQGPLEFTDGKATLEATLDEPGALFLEVRTARPTSSPSTRAGRGPTGRILAGALVNPQALQPTLPRPADFDAWWTGKLAQLRTIPPNPTLEKTDAGRPDVDYYKIQLDTIDGKHIQGQLARPAVREGGVEGGGKYPALLILQWAGIYALQKPWVTNRAAQGWLALNIEPHDMEIDRDPAYYQQLTAGDLRDYFHMGNNDREKSYFLRMYLSACRAADYLATRPDWDGKTLIVMGTSMGGQQSFATAGLHDKVTAMLVLVPSGCDAAGPTNKAPRAAGFPDWAAQAQQKNDPQIIETSRYFDPINFAPHIHATALVAMGLFDETSPPAGVYAAFNQIKGPKEPVPLHSGHQDQAGSQRPYNTRAEQWLDALVKGAPVPPPAP